MKRKLTPNDFVGNGEFLSRAVMQQVVVASSVAPAQPAAAFAGTPGAPALPLPGPRDFTPPDYSPAPTPRLERLMDALHNHSLAVFALLFLAIGLAIIDVGGNYWSARTVSALKPARAIQANAPTIAGLNLTVAAKDLQAKLQTITNQPATLTVGNQTIPVGADTIRGWLQITTSADKSQDYIRIKAGIIAASLQQLANQFVKAPVSQVTVTAGGVTEMVVPGRDGTSLTNPASLKAQADQVAKTVMDSKGLNFSTPLQTQAFQSITPCDFDKSIFADVTTKTMAAFEHCNKVNQWLVSAGKPSTPTPIGEFHVYAKFASQDMRGFNPDGTPYFQPHVRWVNYFSAGSAIHGVYWHPLSWFGVNNSSHGCVGVPDNEAEWIYNWAPIGTTVVTTDKSDLNFMN